MSTDLEKRLAEEFYYTGLDRYYTGCGEGGPIARCARIAAEEIEKARTSAYEECAMICDAEAEATSKVCAGAMRKLAAAIRAAARKQGEES